MRLTILLLLINFNLFGQFRLDVEGDARITGKLDLLSGISNTFIGRRAGESNTEGSGNSFFGLQAGLSNTTDYVNSFFGANAGLANTTGFIK